MERMNENCCPKSKRYRPDYYVKELTKTWPADEEMKNELRLYDEAHSKEKCITIEYFSKLEKDLYLYALGKKDPICSEAKQSLIDCLQGTTYTSNCSHQINSFLKCVNNTIRHTYAPKVE